MKQAGSHRRPGRREVSVLRVSIDPAWSNAKSARALQVATTGRTQAITYEQLPPTWILRLRELPCLPDTRSFYHKPTELLLRTPETEPFMDAEPFVHGRLDREAVRPLLILLGVRGPPTGPGRLLDCLRALAMAEKPPIHEVEKWYRRLDQMMDTCSTADLAPQSRRQLWDIIRQFQQRRGTVLLTTHYMDEAERLCDRLAIIDHGQIIAAGTPSELIARLSGHHVVEFALSDAVNDDGVWSRLPGLQAVRNEDGHFSLQVEEPHETIPALLSVVQQKGARLVHLTTRQASLEDVFVQLTGRHLREE